MSIEKNENYEPGLYRLKYYKNKAKSVIKIKKALDHLAESGIDLNNVLTEEWGLSDAINKFKALGFDAIKTLETIDTLEMLPQHERIRRVHKSCIEYVSGAKFKSDDSKRGFHSAWIKTYGDPGDFSKLSVDEAYCTCGAKFKIDDVDGISVEEHENIISGSCKHVHAVCLYLEILRDQ